MSVRKYRHFVELQNLTATTEAGTRGQSTKAYLTVERIWVSIEQLSGREAVNAEAIVASATHKIELHYTANCTNASRIKFGTRIFGIESVDNVEERNRDMVLLVQEEL